jgi:hypothetical protein
MFDTVLPFTLAQVQLMHHLFEAVALVKPNQSRPANGEKYLVCRNFRGTTYVRDVLFPQWLLFGECIESIHNQEVLARDLLSLLLPNTEIEQECVRVRAYVRRRNDACAQDQLAALTRMHWLMSLPSSLPATTTDHDQQRIRAECIACWKLSSTHTPPDMDTILELARQEMMIVGTSDAVSRTSTFGLSGLAPNVPCVLHLVWFGPRGTMGHWDVHTATTPPKQIAWGMQPSLIAQENTLLLTLWCRGVIYVIDAWCLPGLPQLYRDADLAARRRLVAVYVASCQDARLQVLPLLVGADNDKNNPSRIRMSDGIKPSCLKK